jgi:epoxyqueuosine reductase
LKDKIIPENMHGRFDDWVFGCDTCQDVCPWNRFSKPNLEPELEPLKEILEFSLKDWEELKEEGFREIFSKSPLKRAGFQGIKRNLQFIRRLS